MLDLEKLHSLARETVERVIRDYPENDKILLDIEEIIYEAVRQHARVLKELEKSNNETINAKIYEEENDWEDKMSSYRR